MKQILIAAGFVFAVAGAAAPPAFAEATAVKQDAPNPLDEELQALATKLAKDAASARLADLLRTPEGRQAVRERIDNLVYAKAGRIERDPQGHYEDYLFAPDADGGLRLRAERKDEFERLTRQVARAPQLADGFNKRCDEFAKKIAEATDLDKRAKAAWLDPEFRLALFHRHSANARALGDDELVEALVTKALERGKDGKLHVGGPHRQEVMDFIRGSYGTLDAIKEYEKAYLALAAKEEEAVRQVVTSDAGQVFILGRLIRQVGEGSQESIGGLLEQDPANAEQKGVSFNLALSELAALVKEAEKVSENLKGRFERIQAELAGTGADDLDLFDFLKNERVRMLLAERILAMKRDQHLKIEAIFDAVVQDGFEASGEVLSVKKGRYVDENGNDAVATYEGEVQAVLNEFIGTRYAFDLIAERCAEPNVVELYENRAGTFVLQDHMAQVAASLAAAARGEGLPAFTAAYLVKEGDALAVRKVRHPKIDEIAARAAQIKKELDAQKQDP